MSRAAVFDALVSDPILNGYGISDATVFHNWSKEERPTNASAFIILRWGPEQGPLWQGEVERGPRELTLWVHWALDATNDFDRINVVLDQVDVVLRGLRDVTGNDGYTLSFVKVGSRSPDAEDDGFQTITRNSAYQIFSVAS
jgi:hypothetical protein